MLSKMSCTNHCGGWLPKKIHQWQIRLNDKLPRLSLILQLLILHILITSSHAYADGAFYRTYDSFEVLEEEDRRDILKDLRTSYIPQNRSEALLELPNISRLPRHAITTKKKHRPLECQDYKKPVYAESSQTFTVSMSHESGDVKNSSLNNLDVCNCTIEVCNKTLNGLKVANDFIENPQSLLGVSKNHTVVCTCCRRKVYSHCTVVKNAVLKSISHEMKRGSDTFVNNSVSIHFTGKANSSRENDEKITLPDTTGEFNASYLFDNFWKKRLSYQEVRELQARVMKLYMNASVNPCEDFYSYACGNWKSHFSIPADRISYDTFEMLRENLDAMLKDLLTEYSDIDRQAESVMPNYRYYHFQEGHINATGKFDDGHMNDSRDATTKAKDFFKSCMNEMILDKRGPSPLRTLLKQLGGWPVIDPEWDEKKFDLIWLLAQLKLFNNDILISEWVGPDIKNSEKYIIQVDQTSLGLPSKDYFLDPSNWKYVVAYRDFILTTLNLMGANASRAAQVSDELIDFETSLASIMDAPSDRKNVSAIYLRTTIGTLSAYYPQFDWLRYFTMVLGQNMSPHDQVVCYCLPYLHKLVDLLSNTRQDVIANYIIWRFVRHRTNNLDANFLRAKQKFYYILFGREKHPPRWQFCVSQVNSNMGMAVGSLFVRRYFDETSKNDTLEMTMRLQNSFEALLDNNSWIDEDTKSYAKMKIRKMNLKIGYPDFLLNRTELNKRYVDIEIHPEYFFENVLSLLRHSTRHEQDRVGTMVNKTSWATPPAVVNAYYSRNKNQIMFPAGILQPPFYHQFFPKSLNFGGIGVVIGHEITHGFDDKGRLFDYNGNLQKWWRQSSIDEFHARSQCLIEQYNSYIMPVVHVHIDGELTQGENIADNGGLKEAFGAYRLWKNMNPHADETLPGLNLTGEQLFFLNFAQVWCGIQRPESAKNRMKTAVHSPGLFRVIGTISNSPDFAKVFKCPETCPMNPPNKCVIW